MSLSTKNADTLLMACLNLLANFIFPEFVIKKSCWSYFPVGPIESPTLGQYIFKIRVYERIRNIIYLTSC